MEDECKVFNARKMALNQMSAMRRRAWKWRGIPFQPENATCHIYKHIKMYNLLFNGCFSKSRRRKVCGGRRGNCGLCVIIKSWLSNFIYRFRFPLLTAKCCHTTEAQVSFRFEIQHFTLSTLPPFYFSHTLYTLLEIGEIFRLLFALNRNR